MNIVKLGNYVTQVKTNYLGGACILFIIAFFFYFGYNAFIPESIRNAIDLLQVGVPIILFIAGVFLIILAFNRSMESVYRDDNGYCTIANTKIQCHSNCTQCVFAAQYVRMENIPEMLEISAEGHSEEGDTVRE